MRSSSERQAKDQERTYDRANSVVFLKTDAPFGGLSNMAGGFPLYVQSVRIYTSEALYQACRFPHLPEVQRLIISQASPMTAKMKSKPHRKDSRPDWNQVRVRVMRWCLRVKLAQNWGKFSDLLLRTGALPIVEESRKDEFWGAKPVGDQVLVGRNVLGRLLMELRDVARSVGRDAFQHVEPPDIAEFLLLARPIEIVRDSARASASDEYPSAATAVGRWNVQETIELAQALLFAAPSAIGAGAPGYLPRAAPGNALLGGLKPYPASMNSGVPWLGEVPEHWGVVPNRAIFVEVRERDHPEAEMLSVTITKGVIRQQALLEDGSQKDSSKLDKSAYKLVRTGDIVYNKMRAWQGAIGASEYEGIVSPAYVVQRPREGGVPRYLHYLLRTPAFATEAERWSYGITSDMWSLRPEHFRLICSCLPPVSEQAAIVRFLDHADRRIRRYIRAKQKLIKLLEEQKQAIIHRAVTRGLDSDVRLKPSGVEWLGDVPEHWKVQTLGQIASSFRTGPFGSILHQSDYVDGGIPVVNPTHMRGGSIFADRRCTVPATVADRLSKYILEVHDVVVARRGELGRCALVRAPEAGWICGTGSLRVRINYANLEPEYLIQVLQMSWIGEYLSLFSVGATMDSLNTGILKGVPLLLPPVGEQRKILETLAGLVAALVRVVEGAQREIACLLEYRTRLVAGVVTGKLDVREAAAQLPEEVEGADSEAEAEVYDGPSMDEAEELEEAVDEA